MSKSKPVITKIAVIGIGKGGMALLSILSEDSGLNIVGVANRRQDVPGIKLAQKLKITTYPDFKQMLSRRKMDIVIDASGNPEVSDYLKTRLKPGIEVLSGLGAKLLWKMVEERERGESEMRKSLAEQEALYKIGIMLSSVDKVHKALNTIVTSAMNLVGMSAGSIAMYDEEHGEMEIKVSRGFKKSYMGYGYRWALRKKGVTNMILSNKNPTVINDISKDRHFDHSMLKKMEVVALIAVPLVTEGRIVGVLYVDDFQPRHFTKREAGIMGLLGTQAATALDRLNELERAKKQAVIDELTKLYNHRYFVGKLATEFKRAARYHHSLSLCMVDVDHFKNYNDINGHPQGNEVLTKVARILLAKARECDVVARYGGEEFAIILPITEKKAAMSFAQRIRKAVERYKFNNEKSLPKGKLTISIGVAAYPDDCMGLEDLVECADKALYRAKGMGRNRSCGYEKRGMQQE